MRKVFRLLGATAVVAVAWACSDVRQPNSIVDVEPLQSHVACDLSSVMDAARRYLGSPYMQQVTDKLRALQTGGCTNEQLAWEILGIVETAFNLRVGGSGADGKALVDGVLHCCIESHLPDTYDFEEFELSANVLANGGLFGVRGVLGDLFSNTNPVLSRDPVPIAFSSEGGPSIDRPAIVAIRPRPPATWQGVAFGENVAGTFTDDVMLLTGFPLVVVPTGAAYELDEAPDLGFDPGSQVDVIVCFTDITGADDMSGPDDPHVEGGEGGFQARVQRNGIILLQPVADVNQFCEQYVWGPRRPPAPSVLSSLINLASRLVLPEPLAAVAWTDRTTPGSGGGGSFLSHFSLSNSDVDGTFVFLEEPSGVITKNAPFTVRVEAKSGGGAPIETNVVLALMNNNGLPGFIQGTFTNCEGVVTTSPPAVGCTSENESGGGGVATFSDISISKTGAYILCATATSPGFNFPQICTAKFNVKN
jgi:hypothetical protein